MYNVLIVDHEPGTRSKLENMLRRMRPDYRFTVTGGSVSAVEILDTNPIDIVLTDIALPGTDGFAYMEQLSSRMKKARVVIVSACECFDYVQKAIRLGMFDYVVKPIDALDIEGMIMKLEAAIGGDPFVKCKQLASMVRYIQQTIEERNACGQVKALPTRSITACSSSDCS